MAKREGDWEFYPCRVNDAPASILLDLTFRDAKPSGADTLYFAGLQILEPGDHGMGTGADIERLYAAEDAICDAASGAGLTYVGRLRNGGDWQLTFYGPAGREKALEDVVVRFRGARGYRTGSKADAAWSYYDEFLMPDAERWQWIMNRRVVEQLASHGDDHATPRPIDHYVYFDAAADRDAFAAAATAKGFRVEPTPEGERFGAHLVRTDRVQLGHIHEVVMELRELGEAHGGDYDGWGAGIVKP
ncbi:MAG TPA: DUF695 domain-containing protein [Labilithrix sp.]|jgi:regulator of RNase E activity RraB